MNMTKGLTSTGNIVAETPKYLFDKISSILLAGVLVVEIGYAYL